MSRSLVVSSRTPPHLAALLEQIAATERRMAVLQAELHAINAALARTGDVRMPARLEHSERLERPPQKQGDQPGRGMLRSSTSPAPVAEPSAASHAPAAAHKTEMQGRLRHPGRPAKKQVYKKRS